MSISNRDLLDQAKERPNLSPEVRRRTLISRAYYASYHRCLDWERTLPALGTPKRQRGGIHQRLIERLKAPASQCTRDQVKLSKWLGDRLIVLRRLRVKADYKLAESLDGKQLKGQVAIAQEVFDCCDGRRKP